MNYNIYKEYSKEDILKEYTKYILYNLNVPLELEILIKLVLKRGYNE